MEFKYYTNEIEEVTSLIKEAFDFEIKINDLILQDNQKLLLLKDEDIVVGLSLITEKNDPFRNFKKYYIDYLCIRKSYRHQALGRKLFEEILKLAKDNNINRIELTSRKDRTSARKIYLDYGMTIKDTDLFILDL